MLANKRVYNNYIDLEFIEIMTMIETIKTPYSRLFWTNNIYTCGYCSMLNWMVAFTGRAFI